MRGFPLAVPELGKTKRVRRELCGEGQASELAKLMALSATDPAVCLQANGSGLAATVWPCLLPVHVCVKYTSSLLVHLKFVIVFWFCECNV